MIFFFEKLFDVIDNSGANFDSIDMFLNTDNEYIDTAIRRRWKYLLYFFARLGVR